jgi:drug/metabolite transporter (DMT)-like permease
MKQKSIGYIEIITAVSIWAIASGIIVRWIPQGAEIIYGVGAMAGFIFVYIWLVLKKQTKKIPESYLYWKSLVLVGLFIGLNNGLFYVAIKSTTVANAILAHYFEPILLVLIFAPIVLKQKIKKEHIVSSVLGFAGLFIVLGSQINSAALNFGVLLGLMSAVFFAWHIAIESKLAMSTKIDPLVEVFVLLYRGLAKVSSQNASVIFYGEPVGAIILAWIVWGEQLSFSIIAGGALILAAGYLAVRNK